MHLSDRRRRNRRRLEMPEPAPPVPSPFARQYLVELQRRHAIALVAQPREDRRQFGRQHVARVHRDHLPQLHRRAAQVRQPVRYPCRIRRSQHQIAHPGPLALRQTPRALGQHAARHTAGKPPEPA